METRVKKVLADFLGLQANRVEDSIAASNTAAWDSVTHLNICLALEQEFDVSLSPEEMASMTSFREIVRVLNKHGGG
jgi:acyl carrier protein